MTCIVGYVKNGDIYMGADSIGVSGYTATNRADPKIFINGPMLFGYTSSFRMGQLLRFKLKVPKQVHTNDYNYMCTDFIDSVIECFKDNGYNRTESEEVSGGTFLVGYKGVLYEINDDYQVGINLEPFNAVGCGADIAMGALKVCHDLELHPEECVAKALDAAAFRSTSVRKPFNFIKMSLKGVEYYEAVN